MSDLELYAQDNHKCLDVETESFEKRRSAWKMFFEQAYERRCLVGSRGNGAGTVPPMPAVEPTAQTSDAELPQMPKIVRVTPPMANQLVPL